MERLARRIGNRCAVKEGYELDTIKGARCIVDHLSAIEDILGDDYDLDRLRELIQADQDGRCVVLPKDGMIYFHEESIDGDERWVGNWPIKDVLLKCGFGIESLTYSIEDVGRKIYFSSEAAEAALKGEQHDT